VEGDSASLAELCVLLSAVSGVALRQDVAVTGSVNQHGQVQPVGGVTEKIEGFFDLCRARGLTGTQGVFIPATNRRHLMLRDEVVEAVDEGQFHIWHGEAVDDVLELLTGQAAGEVHAAVARRLGEYTETLKALAADHERKAVTAVDTGAVVPIS
jgi:predicted ATP-dependent protease